jgi:hypothetical protein
MAAEAVRIPDPPLVSVSPADVATAVAARLRTQLPQRVPRSQTRTSLPTAAFEALVMQVASEAVDVLAAAWPRVVAEEQVRATTAATHHRELARIAGQWNQRSRPVSLLGSPGLGCGVNVLPYLHRSVEGRALHATSQEIGRACRLSSTRWAVEVVDTHTIMDECPICFTHYGEQADGSFLTKDGKDNSDYAEVCKHYICHRCCWELSKQEHVKCPLCREDWTDWIHTHYTESDDDEEDE